MASPVLPNDVKALIIDPTASLCSGFINTLLRIPVKLYQFLDWLLDSSGNLSQAALQQIHRPGDLIFSAASLAADDKRLLCDGSNVSQTTYADLYAAIGNTYGSAPAGQFKLPDFRARFPVGVGTFAASGAVALGATGGEDKHTLVEADLGVHKHVYGRCVADAGTAADKVGLLKGEEEETSGTTREVSGGSSALQEADIADDGEFDGSWLNTGNAKYTTDPAAFNLLNPFLAVYIYIAT